MKTSLRVTLAVLAITCVGAAFAQGKDEQMARNRARAEGKTETARPLALRNGGLFERQSNVVPFVPADLEFANHTNGGVRFVCDPANGAQVTGRATFMCNDFTSPSAKSNYRLVFATGGTVIKIFRLQNGNTTPYVEFAGGREVHKVTMKTAEAERFAAGKGYQFDERNQTMVASGGAPSNQAVVAGAPQPQPRPQVAQADACANAKTFLEKAACLKQNPGAAVGGLIKP